MIYKNWTIHTAPASITATKDGEELTIYVTGEKGLKLMKRAIKRRGANEVK